MDLPTYHNPSFIDLNEDQPQHDDHHLFNNPNPQVSSSLTLAYSPLEDQGEFFCRKQPRFPLQVSLEADRKIVSSGGSCEHHPKADHEESESDNNDLKLTIWKNDIIQDTNNNDHEKHTSTKYIDDSVKWTSSKMRMMRKMIITNTDHHRHRHHLPTNFNHKLDNHQITKNFGADHSSSSSTNIINTNTNINNGIIRVCSDCNTTKTPLWRSGPRGPKSLCNACGIRQRKARRAMAAAAAASADGTNINAAVDAAAVKSATTAKIQHKMKKPKISGDQQFKKRSCKLARGRKRLLCFEDLRISMSKSSAFQRGFPQDERDAAILLMALSYGLVRG